MADRTCIIVGCDKDAYRNRRVCNTHAMRKHRYGDLHTDRRRKPTSTQCSVDQCERLAQHRSWCKEHYDRWRRCGDPTATFAPKQVVGYGQAHGRLRTARRCGQDPHLRRLRTAGRAVVLRSP